MKRSCFCLQIFCLDWNCSGSYLASGSQDQAIKLWKIGTKNVSVSCIIGLLFDSIDDISYFCIDSQDLGPGPSRRKKDYQVFVFTYYRFL